jgi:hypothetical protein
MHEVTFSAFQPRTRAAYQLMCANGIFFVGLRQIMREAMHAALAANVSMQEMARAGLP